MKKTSSFAAIAVLLAVVAAIFVSSCSSEYTEEESDFSLSKKEKIEKLAEEYGLSIEVFGDVSSTNIDKIHNDFRSMHSLLGTYSMYPIEDDGKHELEYIKNKTLECFSAPPTSKKENTWTDQKSGEKFTFSVYLSWDVDSIGNATSHTFYASMKDKDIENAGTSYLYSTNSHIVGRCIFFSTNIAYEYLNDSIKYRFTLSGCCDYDTKLGEFDFGSVVF